MARRAKHLVNDIMRKSHPDCQACEPLREHIDKMVVREMNLRVELGEIKRAVRVKQVYANRTRWRDE